MISAPIASPFFTGVFGVVFLLAQVVAGEAQQLRSSQAIVVKNNQPEDDAARGAADGLDCASPLSEDPRAKLFVAPESPRSDASRTRKANRDRANKGGTALSDDPTPTFQADTVSCTRKAAERYRRIADLGGWASISRPIGRDAPAEDVERLRQRLSSEGDLPQNGASGEGWNDALTNAVRNLRIRMPTTERCHYPDIAAVETIWMPNIDAGCCSTVRRVIWLPRWADSGEFQSPGSPVEPMAKDYLGAVHNKILPHFRHAVEEEASELSHFGKALRTRIQAWPGVFDRPINDMNTILQAAPSPVEAEAALEACGRRLRRRWLDAASSAANRSYRSPTAAQITTTATGRPTNFGYERELQPTELERRCGLFFGPAPQGWSADHAVLSSGQAAVASVLHLLETLEPLGAKRPLSAAHFGSYFETTEILALVPSLLHVIASGRGALAREWELAPEIVLIEPVFCDGKFVKVDLAELAQKLCRARTKVKIVIFDDTLIGTAGSPEDDLNTLQAVSPCAVIRVSSGIKLFQGGRELANVGITSVYTPDAGQLLAANIGAKLRRFVRFLDWGFVFATLLPSRRPGSSTGVIRISIKPQFLPTMLCWQTPWPTETFKPLRILSWTARAAWHHFASSASRVKAGRAMRVWSN